MIGFLIKTFYFQKSNFHLPPASSHYMIPFFQENTIYSGSFLNTPHPTISDKRCPKNQGNYSFNPYPVRIIIIDTPVLGFKRKAVAVFLRIIFFAYNDNMIVQQFFSVFPLFSFQQLCQLIFRMLIEKVFSNEQYKSSPHPFFNLRYSLNELPL